MTIAKFLKPEPWEGMLVMPKTDVTNVKGRKNIETWKRDQLKRKKEEEGRKLEQGTGTYECEQLDVVALEDRDGGSRNWN